MRTIKFRFWKDKSLQGIRDLKLNNILDMAWEWDAMDQFTGLLDRNGKEIYEGDIIGLDGFYPSIYVIEFIEGGFCACRGDLIPIDCSMFSDSKCNHATVIGNKHENYNLLENVINETAS